MISSLKFLIKMILSSLAQITRIHLVFKIEDVLKVVRREVFFFKKKKRFYDAALNDRRFKESRLIRIKGAELMRIYSVSRRAQGGLNLIRQSRRHRQAATPKVSTRSRWPGDLSTAPEDEPYLEPVTRASEFFWGLEGSGSSAG